VFLNSEFGLSVIIPLKHDVIPPPYFMAKSGIVDDRDTF